MTNQPGFFDEFQDDFKKADKAGPMQSPGRLPPWVYRVACTTQDLKGDGVLVDHECFQANSGTKGFKLFFEVLEPESVSIDDGKGGTRSVKTKGEILEHVFWITGKTLPFVKRDLSTIVGRDVTDLSEVTKIPWAGKTCEVGVKDEHRDGFVNSRVNFINAWKPGQDTSGVSGAASSKAETRKVAQPAAGQKKAAAQPKQPAAGAPVASPGKEDMDF